jgi:hypothetical protein
VTPFFDDFRLQPRQLKPGDINMEWASQKLGPIFRRLVASDGTLRFIALATLFLQFQQFRPSVILVDEPELGLHPSAIEMLASLIRQASGEYAGDCRHAVVRAAGSPRAGRRSGGEPRRWWHSAYAFEVGGVGRVAFSKAKA